MKNKLHGITLILFWCGVGTILFALCMTIHTRSKKIDELNLKVQALQYSVDSLENQINEYYSSITDMRDAIQWQEEEISYWGQQYNSTKIELEKYKKKK